MSASHRDGQGARPADIELFEENAPLPGTPSRSSLSSPSSFTSPPSSPPRPAPATHRSARRSPRRRKQAPALLIGTVTVGIGTAISISLVCDAFTARHSEFSTPASSALSARDSATPSPSAPSTAPAHPAREAAPARVTPTTAGSPSSVPPLATPSAPPSGAPSTPAGPPAGRPSPPRDRTRSADRPGLALGSTGHDVEDLQRRLQQLHLYLGSDDGNFTVDVEVALSRYQKARNIPEEPGVYGPMTRAALRSETESTDRNSHRYGDSDQYEDSYRYGDSYR
ncbi:peptidoglycan-binding protein [Streptomyces sp. NPDC087290]|uniref:peptidoglycan-binding domain-containing protein n=1 Tax=Streptomyces sp. NPDC087290 TaxID=3365776 RepID=UPI00381B73DA